VNMSVEDETSASSGSSGPPVKLIVLLVVAILTVVFVFRNGGDQKIDFLFFDVETRTWTALAMAVVLGVLLDRLFISWWRRRKRRNEG
jgi:uncharacterized integral membrane protein